MTENSVPVCPPPPAHLCGGSFLSDGYEEIPTPPVLEVAALHELHSRFPGLVASSRIAAIPSTILSLSSSNMALDLSRPQQCRGLIGSWVKSVVGQDWAHQHSAKVSVWCAAADATVDGCWIPRSPFPQEDDQTRLAAGALPSFCLDGRAVAVPRLQATSAHEAADFLMQSFASMSTQDGVSLVVVGADVSRNDTRTGCEFETSFRWVDVDIEGRVGQLIEPLLSDLEYNNWPSIVHPLQEVMASALRGESAVAVATIEPKSGLEVDAPQSKLASLAQRLRESLQKGANHQLARARTTYLQALLPEPGEAASPADISDLDFSVFAGSVDELSSPSRPPLQELLSSPTSPLTSFGFPGHALPSLQTYMSHFVLTPEERTRLVTTAEAELKEYQELGWVRSPAENETKAESRGDRDAAERVSPDSAQPATWKSPSPLFRRLADSCSIPEAHLSTTAARSYARSQDQADPLVRTVWRLREDSSLVPALLPLCAVHPLNPLRLLRLGGLHSLLGLLSDASTLAPAQRLKLDEEEAKEEKKEQPSEALGSCEMAILTLCALCCSFAALRGFLVSQCIFELLAITIRHAASDRHLLLFSALLVSLCREPKHRQLASQVVGQALAEQLENLLDNFRRGQDTTLIEAVSAAAASLSPYLPPSTFGNLVLRSLNVFGSQVPASIAYLASGVASHAARTNDPLCGKLAGPLLAVLPVAPPEALEFNPACLGLLALSPRRLDVPPLATQLAWKHLASTAASVVSEALRGDLGGAGCLRVNLPITSAKVSAERFLQGHSQLVRLKDLPMSPNMSTFQEQRQFRLIVNDEQAEVLLLFKLLPLSHCCPRRVAVCGCQTSSSSSSSSPEGLEATAAQPLPSSSCGGQLGFYLCALPEHSGGGGGDSGEEVAEGVHPWGSAEAAQRRHQLDLRAPLHASVGASGRCEHQASVVLPRGAYTLIPFSSHEALSATDAPELARRNCRKQHCGCVDMNLQQEALWDRSGHHAVLSVWSASQDVALVETSPWRLQQVVSGNLLTQSVPLWLTVPEGRGPVEVLLFLADEEGEVSLPGSEPMLDLWPRIPYRCVRNERTGALRIYIEKLEAKAPVRVSCLWQENIDSASWKRRAPRLLVYSSAPLELQYSTPKGGLPSALLPSGCNVQSVLCRWEAACLFAGSWAPGFSSGMASLRNPQVVLQALRPPGPGEELHLDFYLSMPLGKIQDAQKSAIAISVYVRQASNTFANAAEAPSDAPSRLFEGQLRKELVAASGPVGKYVTTHLTLTGAEARQQLFVVLQNNEPQEVRPWQLRVLARVGRPYSTMTTGGIQPDSGNMGHHEAWEAPEDPPLRCAALGGFIEPPRLYACWPEGLALYISKASRAARAAQQSKESSTELPVNRDAAHLSAWSWALSDTPWDLSDVIQVSSGQAKLSGMDGATRPRSPWPEPQPWPEAGQEFDCTLGLTSAAPPKTLSEARRARRAHDDSAPIHLSGAAAEEETRSKASVICTANGGWNAASKALQLPPRKASLSALVATTAEPGPSPTLSRELVPARQGVIEATPVPASSQAPVSERHLRVEALMRRRRQAYNPSDEEMPESSPMPTTSTKGTAAIAATATAGPPTSLASSAPLPLTLQAPREPRPHGHRPRPGSASRDGVAPKGDEELRPGTAYSAQLSMMPPPPCRPLMRPSPKGPSTTPASPRQSQPPLGPGGGAVAPGVLPPPLQGKLPPIARSREGTPRSQRSGSRDGLQTQDDSVLAVESDSTLKQVALTEAPKAVETTMVPSASRCCNFSGHPVFCCTAGLQASRDGLLAPKLSVRLDREEGAGKLGFGNVAAGPPNAPLLVITWIRDGALSTWNASATTGFDVPVESVISSVNGCSGDVLRMREQLREKVVVLEVVRPDRWRKKLANMSKLSMLPPGSPLNAVPLFTASS